MKHPNPSKLGAAQAARDRQADVPPTLADLGIHNRADARRRGLRNRRKQRTMRVPK